MQIYLINLERAPERLQKMTAQLQALGCGFEVLRATDGRNLTDAERDLVDHDQRKRFTPYPLSDNEIGCWLSHRRAMQQLVGSGAPMAAIVEDDALLSANFADVLQAIEARAAPFDSIDLHRNFRRDESFAPCRTLLPTLRMGRIGYAHMNLTAYVMSRAGAQKFLHATPRFVHAVDKELHRYWANGLDLYGLEQPVAKQDDGGYSYIDETRGQDKPGSRLRYADADQLISKLRRKWSKLKDSAWKRAVFPVYVRRGKLKTIKQSDE